ncbi:MAG: polysulfide reductase NrfD, partial [Myxococcales bacterium]|nr:polysulfide reductase NrfD [Myxococcales bacterium]
YKPIARFSMVSSFVFLLVGPLPLMNHLGRPQRGFLMLVTPNFASAMAGFGYIYLILLAILLLAIWFEFRSDLIQRSKDGGVLGLFLKVILLGQLRLNDETRTIDRRAVRVIMAIGIPIACFLGYVGFLFGSIKANPWWSTPMMFMIFLLSSIVSGIAVILFLYTVIMKWRGTSVDLFCVQSLARYLWGFMIIAVFTELLEVLTIAYEQSREWNMLYILITEKLFWTFVVMQISIGSGIPFVLLGVNALVRLKPRVSIALIFISSALLLIQVMFMRWNVVIGGQLLSKSGRGFISYVPDIWEKEGLLMALFILTIPFVALGLFHKVVPIFPPPHRSQVETR